MTEQDYLHNDESCPCWQCRWPNLYRHDKPTRVLAQLYHLEHLQQVLDVGDLDDALDMRVRYARNYRAIYLFEHHGVTRVGFSDVVDAWERVQKARANPVSEDSAFTEARLHQKADVMLAMHQMGPYNGDIPRTREGLRAHIADRYAEHAEEEAWERARSRAAVKKMLEGLT